LCGVRAHRPYPHSPSASPPTTPGHVSTTLHQSASANPDFRFVNVSCWDSADDFRAATQSEAFREASAQLEAHPIHAAVYDTIET